MIADTNLFDRDSDELEEDEPTLSSPNLSDRQIENLYEKGRFRVLQERNDFMLPQVLDYVRKERWINTRPEYQRRLRWDNKKKSQLIESFIMNIPVPPIFLFENDLNQYEVMDGQQRLNAITEFYNNEFKLSGLKVWSSLHGRNYASLPPKLKRGLDRAKISSVILISDPGETEKLQEDIRSHVFERLNTGGEKLNAQELRNSLYSGPLNDLIIELSSSDLFTKVWGIPNHSENITGDQVSEALAKNTLYSKMGDCEIVLRYFAFRDDGNISGSVRGMLDRTMRTHRLATEEWIEAANAEFKGALELSYHIFGDQTFRLPADNGRRPLSRPLYDAVMCSVAALTKLGRAADMMSRATEIRNALDGALDGPEIYAVIVGRPNTSMAIRDRIAAVRDLIETCL